MRLESERGVALVVALLAMLLMGALGAGLVLISSSEVLVAGRFRYAHEALEASEAALERATDELQTVGDWDRLLDGSVRSALVDGPPSGARRLPDGTVVDLDEIRSLASCGATTCAAANMDAVTADRPWGRNNPRWRSFAYGPLSDLVSSPALQSPFYVVVMVGDDPAEDDGDPVHDGVGTNPGAGVVVLRVEAFGPRGVHRVVEATVARAGFTTAAPGAGMDPGNARTSGSAVQSPGMALDLEMLTPATGGIR